MNCNTLNDDGSIEDPASLTDYGCRFWGAAAEWTTTEASILANGASPDLLLNPDSRKACLEYFLVLFRRIFGTEEYLKIMSPMSIGGVNMEARRSPTYWVDCFIEMDMNVPPALIAEVRQNAGGASAVHMDQRSPMGLIEDVDPTELPEELDAANIAFRAVSMGFGDASETFRNRLLAFLKARYPGLTTEARERIATVANPDKARGRKTTTPRPTDN